MSRPVVLTVVAAVLAGTAAVMAALGLLFNPILLLAAVPFAAATYLLWSHATGRLDARMRERAAGVTDPPEARRDAGRRSRPPAAGTVDPGPDDAAVEAAHVLGVAPGADEATVRRAFRRRVREVHPDAAGGDEAAFRRVREAYEVLRDDR